MCEQLVLQEQQLPFSEQIALSSQKAPFLSARKAEGQGTTISINRYKRQHKLLLPLLLAGNCEQLWHWVWTRAPHTAPGRPLGEGTNACFKVSFLLPGLGAPAHGDGRLARRAFPHPRQGHHTGCSKQLWEGMLPGHGPALQCACSPSVPAPSPHHTAPREGQARSRSASACCCAGSPADVWREPRWSSDLLQPYFSKRHCSCDVLLQYITGRTGGRTTNPTGALHQGI